jgi:hypothetical protein
VDIRSGINVYESDGCGAARACEAKLTTVHFGRAVEEFVS